MLGRDGRHDDDGDGDDDLCAFPMDFTVYVYSSASALFAQSQDRVSI